jgi:8-oxo-dGTP pyrophosphatase MutT (NUDIX family)
MIKGDTGKNRFDLHDRSASKVQFHFGVYGVVLNEDRTEILVVEKSRGPYKGFYDLPGGQPLLAEMLEETLARELMEETGGAIIPNDAEWQDFDLMVERDSEGNEIKFRHRGTWKQVQLSGIDLSIKGEDVEGVYWRDIEKLKASVYVSPPLLLVLNSIDPLAALPPQ